MVIIRCCSLVTPLTAAIFAGCAKLPFPGLEKPAEQSASSKSGAVRSPSTGVDVWMTINGNAGFK